MTSDSTQQFYIITEQDVLIECVSMSAAVLDLFAAYFAFDIAYPKQNTRDTQDTRDKQDTADTQDTTDTQDTADTQETRDTRDRADEQDKRDTQVNGHTHDTDEKPGKVEPQRKTTKQ